MYKCNVCDCEFSEDEGGLTDGVIGIIPVSFCPTCFSGIREMLDFYHIEELRVIESQLQKSVKIVNKVRNFLRSRIDGG